MKFAVSRRDDASIDVTPMIDVVFQLVLFFMVSTTFATAPGFEVDLPHASSQTIVQEEGDVQIWMTLDGAVYVNDVAVDAVTLQRTLLERAESNPNTLVVIKADTGVAHGRVVGVMDRARAVGLTRLAIATEIDRSEDVGPKGIMDQ